MEKTIAERNSLGRSHAIEQPMKHAVADIKNLGEFVKSFPDFEVPDEGGLKVLRHLCLKLI